MDELEEMRQRRLQELQKQQAASQDEAAQQASARAEQESAVEGMLQKILDSEARERLTRIRMSRPGLADQVVRQLVALAQSGRLQMPVTDVAFEQILTRFMGDDREPTITRR